MKKILLLFMLPAYTFVAAADETTCEIDGITYSLESGIAKVKGFDNTKVSADEVLTLNGTITYGGENYTVEANASDIDDGNGFSGLNVKSIVLNDFPVSANLFEGNTHLESVAFSTSSESSVLTIGESAFSGCSSLTSVVFGDGVSITEIPAYAFQNTSLSEINIPDTVEKIGQYAYYDGEGYFTATELTIPSSVTTIAGSAFKGGYANLTIITIEDDADSATTRTYGADAFAGDKTKLTMIASWPATAPVASSEIFSQGVYEKATLGMPDTTEAVKSSYSDQPGWKKFFTYNHTTGVEVVAADGAEIYTVYDMNGVLRLTSGNRSDINALSPGIYVVNGKKTAVK